jgi:hypothetical protein
MRKTNTKKSMNKAKRMMKITKNIKNMKNMKNMKNITIKIKKRFKDMTRKINKKTKSTIINHKRKINFMISKKNIMKNNKMPKMIT